MLAQCELGFQYESEKTESNLTSFGGLPLYLEMARVSGLCSEINTLLKTKTQGWTDGQTIMSLLLLNIAGGDCVEDINRLESDKGLQTLLLALETQGMRRTERREYERRWHKLGKNDAKKSAFPSASSIRRYLEQFHNAGQEALRVDGKAFIPAPNKVLSQLMQANGALIRFAQRSNPVATATLDQDATLSSTQKNSALYCYEKYKAYQPLNTYWHEQGLLLHSEFRDGNVPAGYEETRVLKEALEVLPEGVTQVYLRTDTAGYQRDLLRYCAKGENERFGVIEFAIGADVNPAFKKAVNELKPEDWKPLYREAHGEQVKTEQEWAEVCFVPNWVCHKKDEPHYRFLAIREKMAVQEDMLITEILEKDLPFQTMELGKNAYKIFGVVTNRTIDGNELINWHRKRCGDSERVHSTEKSELAGGQFPSSKFGANAAWWQIMVMAFNLNALMKRLALPAAFKKKQLKAIRFYIIGVAGRVVKHARRLIMKLGAKAAAMMNEIRRRILALTAPLLEPGGQHQ